MKALPDQDLYRVRGVAEVEWAVPLLKSTARAKVHTDGKFRAVILMGIDDGSLVGAPRSMALDWFDFLRKPNSIVIDRVGYEFFFPGEPMMLSKQLEMNDRSGPWSGSATRRRRFVNFPIVYRAIISARRWAGSAT